MPRCMSTLRVHHLNAIAASGQKQCHSQKVAQRNNIFVMQNNIYGSVIQTTASLVQWKQ